MELSVVVACLVFAHLLLVCTGQGVAIDCDKCTRDPSYCRRISGLYTVTVLSKGTYNPVVEVPAPACSINITELRSSKNYLAVKTVSNKGIINSYWALGQPGQYFGAGTRFSYNRQSGSCPGGCIYAEGPILENVVIQLLYNDINPGIAYEFVIPKHVEFKPYGGTPARSDSKSAQTASEASSSRNAERRVSRHHRRRRPSVTKKSDGPESKGEYYSGSVSIRSEGRPEETAEATGQLPASRRLIANQRTADTKRISYGSHTLGGRGLSYTAYNSARRRKQGESNPLTVNRSGRRYSQKNRQLIRKIASPTYVPPSSSSNSRSAHSKQPRYQSFSAKTSYSNGIVNRNNNYLRTYERRNNGLRASSSTRYRWKISGLTECSKSCGGGVQKTNVVCASIGTRTQVVVTPDNCENLYRPRAQTVECNTSPCDPAWEADEWSACSVTCGFGTQTRKIECRQRFSRTLTLKVSADQCGLEDKPAVAQQCEEKFCAVWQTGVWSQCSENCGGGERQRDVRCVDSFNSPVPSNFCIEAKPRDREICNSQACRAQWWLSDWSSECTETCGTGYQFRKTLCLNENGDITTESSCDTKVLPELRQFCESANSCPGTWITSAWGKCSARCGRGRRKRTVVCMLLTSTTMQQTEEGDCNRNLKPPSEEACVEANCPSLWYASTWSQCSATCGRGYKTRDVKCLDENDQSSVSCPPSLKPETRKMCTLDSCNLYQRTDGKESDESEESEESEESDEDESEESFEDLEEETGEYSEKFESSEVVETKTEHDAEEAIYTPIQSPSATVRGSENNDHDCKDSFYNCRLVIQSRLCPYEYYRKRCCHSCRKSYGY